MRSIILCNSEANVNYVYSESVKLALSQQAGLEQNIYSREDVLQQPAAFHDVDFIFSTWGMPSFTEEEIDLCFPNLKRIFYAAGTVQSFARPFLQKGIQIHSAWIANAIPVAEYTVAQILLANKGYFQSAHQASSGDYAGARQNHLQYPGNYDTRVGIIGLGAIGDLVCQMLKPYQLQVVAYSRSLTQERADAMGVEKSDIETIFKTCQVVSNHIANNPHTRGIFNKDHFLSMVPNGVFLNTGRGAQVVEADLICALSERPDITAVLDVTDPEPPRAGSLFYTLPNCILTPHIAGSSGSEVHRMAEYMLQEFSRYCANQACLYEVSLKMLETMA
jgi:phosphoglycerate dehydrogenase-like enzyme